jgi:hypothetical protein
MSTYLPDTNVIVTYGRDSATKTKTDRASASGSKFVIAPPTMTVGVVKDGATWFAQSKVMFEWLKSQSANILDLPRLLVLGWVRFPSEYCSTEVPTSRKLRASRRLIRLLIG